MRAFILGIFSIFLFLGTSVAQTKNHFDNKPFVEGEFLIQLSDEVTLKQIIASAPVNFNLHLKDYISPPMRIWLVGFDFNVMTHAQMQDWLYNQRNVTAVDYNYYLELRTLTPDDPSFNSQWHHVNTGQTGGTPDADIDSDLAWEITTGGKTATNDDIVVCMIESGNLNHPDLAPNRWVNVHEIPGNGIDDDGNGYVDDYNGWNPVAGNDAHGTGAHGTNCLGMIGAKGDNNLNVVGANWDVKMMVIGGYSISTQANAIQAYTYPLVMRKLWNQTNGERGAFVVVTSSSWGLDSANPNNYPIWCQFYDTLGFHGVLNIGATTNSNLNVDNTGDMPTACNSNYMIGVGRTDHNDNTAGGYGRNTIYFGAPGINVVTTAGNSGITTTTGTSFSCPLTAGVVGLAYSIPCTNFMSLVRANPQDGADLVRQALLDGVDVKTQLETRFITGGRLNAKNTLDLLMEETCSTCNAIVTEVSTTNTNATIEYSAAEDATNVELKYRAVGAQNWSTINGVNGVAQIVDLTECTVYEYYLVSTCENEMGEGAINTFSSGGCGACIESDYCATKATGSTTPRLAFTNVTTNVDVETTLITPATGWGGSLTNGYNYSSLILMKGSGANANEGCGTITNAGQLAGNIAVVTRGTCEFSEKALNAQNAGATALIIVNNAGGTATMGIGSFGASITIPVVMLSNTFQASLINALDNGQPITGLLGVQNEWIQSFSINGETYVTADDAGYASPNVAIGQVIIKNFAIPFTIAAGFANQLLPELSRIWIDLNQDGEFSQDELLYEQVTPSATATTSGTFMIPDSALEGNTRLRVQMAYKGAGQEAAPSVCGNFTYGEVEDYCVSIQNSGVGVELVSANEIKIYPNPAMDAFRVDNLQANTCQFIRVVDATGRVISEIYPVQDSITLDCGNWTEGTYTLQFIGAEGVYTKKVVVIR